MNPWWEDAATLLFKRGLLLTEQGRDAFVRYWAFLKKATAALAVPFVILSLFFVLFALLGLESALLYQSLIVLISLILIALIAIWLPILIPLEAILDALPTKLKASLQTWPRRMAAILFCALAVSLLISMFELWRVPGRMLVIMLIIGMITLGGYIGWFRLDPAWRAVVRAGMWIVMSVLLLGALLPGPAVLIRELGHSWYEGIEDVVVRNTRPESDYWYPTSEAELRSQLIDFRSGRAQVWFTPVAGGGFKLARSKGYNEYGEPLEQADTQSEIETLLAWQRERDVAREAEERKSQAEAGRRQEAARRLVEEQAVQLAEQWEQDRLRAARAAAEEAERAEALRIASYVAALPSERVDYIVYGVGTESGYSTALTSAVVRGLTGTGRTKADGAVLTPAFASDAGFGRASMGRGADDLRAMKLHDVADRLLLVQAMEAASGMSASLDNVHTFRMTVFVTVITTETGERVRVYRLEDVVGAGVNEGAAKAAFFVRLADRIADAEGTVQPPTGEY